MRTGFIILLIFLVNQISLCQGHFTFSPEVKKVYDKTLSLRLTEAKNLLSQIKTTDPENLMVYLVEDYIDFFTVFIHEDKDEFNKLKRNKDRRILEIRKGDKTSPYYLYSEADIRLHWALLHLRFGEYYTAFTEVNKAFKLLNSNTSKFPDFMPNLKDLGILHAAVGTIPDNYKWGIELMTSLEGSIQQGQGEIEKLLIYAETNDFPFEAETKVLYAFLLLHLGNEKDKAWEVINSNALKPQSNPLHCFVMANLAMRTDRNDEAIKLLENRPRSRAFLPMPYLDFMLGMTKLRRLDKDAAQYFQSYLAQFNGRHFIKEAWQKLAWSALLNDNPIGYTKYMQNCLSRGNATAGGDKNALKEAQSSQLPNITMLKARLLFDGGYYQQAYNLLNQYSMEDFSNQYDKLEFTYRLGRVLHGLKRHTEAIYYYSTTINSGRSASWFFACNAALQTGKIYEDTNRQQAAINAYKTCLSISPDEYKTGLHQQAKAGLDRLK
jgi:tetratricopeptide (TPR) repeat protein